MCSFLKRFLFLLLILLSVLTHAQDTLVIQLKQQLSLAKTDTARVNRLVDLSNAYQEEAIEALHAADEALRLAQKIKYGSGIAHAQLALGRAYGNLNSYEQALRFLNEAGERYTTLGDSLGMARALNRLAWIKTQLGDYASAYELDQQSLRLAQQYGDSALIRRTYTNLGSLHIMLGDYSLALDYLTTAMDMLDRANDLKNVCRTLNMLGELYRFQGDPERAQNYYEKAIRMAEALNSPHLLAQAESNMAAVQVDLDQPQEAIVTAHRALRVLLARGQYEVVSWAQTVMARAQLAVNRPDSAVYYGQLGWNLSRQIGYKEVMRDASDVLSKAYARQNNYRLAYDFQQRFMAYNDTLVGAQTRQQVALLQQNANQAEKQAQAVLETQERRRRSVLLSSLIAGLVVLSLVAYILYRNNRQKQRSNALLQQQRDQLEQQRDQTTRALTDLKAAQTQLVQQEKLASLGELTAGIAHEIQNPLNFVNNFAEVSVELVQEIKDERQKPQDSRDEELEGELLDDLAQNLQKINHHGGRASGIVRSMLAHSRRGNNQKEATDLNALADEYLRLAYHGLRAKDKTFNAELKTDFTPDLPTVSVVSQDIGRVLLNLFNNGFYATQQRAKKGEPGYQPTLSVSTQRTTQGICIRVRDNGTGMPEAVKAKIFQPFFTTKPTGEGTGLGMSLSYDIITKGHGGELEVQSTEGEGTEFVVRLPV
jgi:two-component system, NtrC family, sensor kinase